MPDRGPRLPGSRLARRIGALTLAAPVLLTLVGCLSSPSPELLRRYAAYEVDDTVGLVDVTVFSAPVEAWAGSTRLEELSASAQAELVEAVAARTSSADALLRALGRPIGADAARQMGVTDRTRFRRRLVISAENHAARPARAGGMAWTMRPAGRINRLRISLGLDTSVARFVGWDRFASRYETVDLGEMTSSRRATARLDLDAAGDVVGDLRDRAGLDVGGSATLDEELPLRRRYVSTGTLRPDSLVLLQEGAVGVDLTGNSIVEVEIDLADSPARVRTFAFQGLWDPRGGPRGPDSVAVVPAEIVHVAGGAGDVAADLRFESVVRTVRPGSGDATWAEGDDHARFLVESRHVPGVVLVPEAETRASVWQLSTPGCAAFLHIESEVGDLPSVVQLGTSAEAFELLRWLRRSPAGEIGRRRLYLGPGRRLTRVDVGRLRVRMVPLNWDFPEGLGCPA